MSAVKFLKVEDRKVFVKGLDAMPGSPVIDIKPYAEVFDLPYGSVLNREEIEKRIVYENLISDYIDLKIQLQPNGFDCTLKSVAKLKGAGKIDFDNKERLLPEVEPIPFENDWVFLNKGTYRASLNEIVSLTKNLMAIAMPRSTLARAGIELITAVWDAGYKGRSEVGLIVHNTEGVWLKRNARIIQLVFIKLTDETQPYNGVYQEENI
jgi:dUTP pyrophosphatase